MNVILTYWPVIVIAIVLIVWVIYECKLFYKMPNSEKVKRIKACLLNWVTIAAQKYDEGEMDLAIAEVYTLFCNKFPVLKSLIPLDTVKEWIKESFDKFKGILASENKTLATFRNPMGINITSVTK